MTSSQLTAVPTDVADVTTFTENFRARYGVSPIAGGETLEGAPPAAAAPPAPEPAAAPVAPPGEPAAAAPEPVIPVSEATAQQLLSRFDEFGAQPPDPIAVDLGLVQPPPAMPGQPQGQPGAYPPGQFGQPPAPAQPNPQPGAQLPGVDPNEKAAIDAYVEARSEAVVERILAERVDPRFAQQDVDRRRAETEALVEGNPELRDPQVAEALMARARNWATQLGNPEMAREPGFLELTYRAAKQMEAAQAAGAQAPAAPVPGQGEVPIEQPGPAAPAGAIDNQDPGQRIVAAGKGSGLSSFWV